MSFDGAADSYSRFMGRYSSPLAAAFADLVDVQPGGRALDVGCGPGALTEVLAGRLGPTNVCAIDPSVSFVATVEQRLPGVEVALGDAERLPYAEESFDVVLAQLVVHFMADPVAGLAEMARVARPGGIVGANVWDYSPSCGAPLALFWRAVRDLDPAAPDESMRAGVAPGQLAGLFESAGMAAPSSTSLSVPVVHPTFDEWWEPFTLGVGPAGAYVASLDAGGRERLRSRCAALQPAAPFTVNAAAWTVWWRKPPTQLPPTPPQPPPQR
jgi:SAM-dependent methyltransferase